MFDVLITGGTVIDGSGAPRRRADVGVSNGKIQAIGSLGSEPAKRKIDATGLIVAPGFIDSHCHSDIALVANPTAPSKVHQGVTTEIIGNCGWSSYPLSRHTKESFIRLGKPVFGYPEVQWDWKDLPTYFAQLNAQGTSVNVGSLIGHGAVRAAVMDFDDRAPTLAELSQMCQLVEEGMAAGALGISTGLSYPPGVYAKTEELTALSKVVARHGGIYATHLRDQVDHLEESVEEALTIGRGASVSVLISHHKTSGPRNFGKVRSTLRLLENARAEGLKTHSDMYPYIAGATTMLMLLPPWIFDSGHEALLARLADPKVRQTLLRNWEEGIPCWENRVGAIGWESITISYVATEKNRDVEGLTVPQAAARRGKSIVDFLCDLLVEERGEVGQILQNSCEQDMLMVMLHPNSMVGSDGIDVGERPHPRQYDTFPKILGELVREREVMSLETAIHKMTGYTAKAFNLDGRGIVKEGFHADLAIFDPTTIQSRSTFQKPRQYPVGIEWVMLNGKFTLDAGKLTGELSGSTLRRSS